jgi:hypothetical protein
MATTLDLLERRLSVLEQEVASLRQQVRCLTEEETPAQRGESLLRQAECNQPAISSAIAKAFAEMGISGQAIGAEKLQEMFTACGIKPEDNEFSRGIIAMREE